MQKPQPKHIKIAAAIIVFALLVIAGVVWWSMQQTNEAKQREAAEAAAARQAEAQQEADENYVVAEALPVRFEQSDGITVSDPKGGDFPYVSLVSEELKQADYSCEGENSGIFGRLEKTDTKGFGPQPTQYRMIDEDMYGFVSSLTKNCYKPELINKYRNDVPKIIIETIEKVEE